MSSNEICFYFDDDVGEYILKKLLCTTTGRTKAYHQDSGLVILVCVFTYFNTYLPYNFDL